MAVLDTNIRALDKYPCGACGAQAEWNPAKQLLVRPFCGTAAPFKVTEAQVRERIRQWYASKWLAPGMLRRRALVDRVRGVYIPLSAWKIAFLVLLALVVFLVILVLSQAP